MVWVVQKTCWSMWQFAKFVGLRVADLLGLLFVLLFVVLMILRPIQSWVHLLEDEEHRRLRLLRFYMQWVPDILAKRQQVYRDLEETFSACLKKKQRLRDARTRMSFVGAEYLMDLQWVHYKLRKHDLDEEFRHLINVILFYEGKRAYKMSRLYSCELIYLKHPHVVSHNDNLKTFRDEMLRYEAHVSAAITAVEEFKVPNVTLWREQCGLTTRTRKETQIVLIKCFPSGRFLITFLIIMNLIFIYRGPALIKSLYQRWYDRRRIVFASLREYLKDVLTVCIVLLVLATLYKAPFLFAEVTDDIVCKRSWQAVRKTAKRYPPKMGQDLVDFLKKLFSWVTVRFFFAAIVCGSVWQMPAHMFLAVMEFLLGKGFCSSLTTLILYVIFFGFPFALVYALAHLFLTSGQDDAVVMSIGAFGIFLMVVLILAAVLTFRNRGNTFSVKPKAYDYVRFSWTNVHVLVFQLVEFLQTLALVFTVVDVRMFLGAATLNNASSYHLLDFVSFEVKFWVTTALLICWFFLCGIPVILEKVVKSYPDGTFAKQVSWTLLVSLFSNTLFVTILKNFLSFVACSYNVTCPGGNATRSSSNGTDLINISTPHCANSVLIDNPRMECWEGEHRGIAVYGLAALVWYATTAIIFGTRYGGSDNDSQDLKFSPIYNVFINIAKAVMVGVVALVSSKPYITLGFLAFINMAALLFTLLFRPIVGFSLSNSFLLVMWRAITFLCGIIAAISAIVGIAMNDINSYVPLGIFLGGTALVLSIAAIVTVVRVVKRNLTPVEQQRKRVRELLLQLEHQLVRNKYMVKSWSKCRKQWRRLVGHVYEAQKDNNRLKMRGTTCIYRYLREEVLHWHSSSQECNTPTPPPTGELAPTLDRDVIDADYLHPPPSYRELFPNTMEPSDPIPAPSDLKEEIPSKPTPLLTANMHEDHEGRVMGRALGRAFDPRMKGETEKASTIMIGGGRSSDDVQTENGSPFDSIRYLGDALENPPDDIHQAHAVVEMECYGKDLLLTLEKHIHYSAFSFAFVSELLLWRSVVGNADWAKLLECLRNLESGLNGTFIMPTPRRPAHTDDVTGGNMRLEADIDRKKPPVFVPESRDPEVLKTQSDDERRRFLERVASVENHGERWAQILEKLLPTTPVYGKCSWDPEELSFTLKLRRAVRGTVTKVGPRGIKMAEGASLRIPKIVKGQFTLNTYGLSMFNTAVSFIKGYEPKCSKGPVSVLVRKMEIFEVDNETYITAQWKRGAFAKMLGYLPERVDFNEALDCLHEVEWK